MRRSTFIFLGRGCIARVTLDTTVLRSCTKLSVAGNHTKHSVVSEVRWARALIIKNNSGSCVGFRSISGYFRYLKKCTAQLWTVIFVQQNIVVHKCFSVVISTNTNWRMVWWRALTAGQVANLTCIYCLYNNVYIVCVCVCHNLYTLCHTICIPRLYNLAYTFCLWLGCGWSARAGGRAGRWVRLLSHILTIYSLI